MKAIDSAPRRARNLPPLQSPGGLARHGPLLPMLRVGCRPALWIVGAHGGSAESSIAALDAGWAAAGHTWPQGPGGIPAPCIVTARTSAHGLVSAQKVLAQWASSAAGNVDVQGLVLVADAPGRLPRPLKELADVVAGGAPRLWRLGWSEAWRLGVPDLELPAIRALRAELKTVESHLPAAAGWSSSHHDKEIQYGSRSR